MGIEIVSEALALVSNATTKVEDSVGVYFEMCAQKNWWSPFPNKWRTEHGQEPVHTAGGGGVVCLPIIVVILLSGKWTVSLELTEIPVLR